MEKEEKSRKGENSSGFSRSGEVEISRLGGSRSEEMEASILGKSRVGRSRLGEETREVGKQVR